MLFLQLDDLLRIMNDSPTSDFPKTSRWSDGAGTDRRTAPPGRRTGSALPPPAVVTDVTTIQWDARRRRGAGGAVSTAVITYEVMLPRGGEADDGDPSRGDRTVRRTGRRAGRVGPGRRGVRRVRGLRRQ